MNRILSLPRRAAYRVLSGAYRCCMKFFTAVALPGRRLSFGMKNVEENARKYGTILCRVGGRDVAVPVRNEFGDNYPSYATDVVDRLFGIRPDDVVLDVGGGGNPLRRANLVLDRFPLETTHRGEPLKLHPHQKLIEGNVERMDMLKDKSVDFLFTQQTLEHVDDPARACAEIIRVAKRGFIDVPRGWIDLHIGHVEHRWFIDFADDCLVFSRKPLINTGGPIFGFVPLLAYKLDPSVGLMMEYYYRNVGCVQLAWQGAFNYRVKN
jgi:hypothetical protein